MSDSWLFRRIASFLSNILSIDFESKSNIIFHMNQGFSRHLIKFFHSKSSLKSIKIYNNKAINFNNIFSPVWCIECSSDEWWWCQSVVMHTHTHTHKRGDSLSNISKAIPYRHTWIELVWKSDENWTKRSKETHWTSA